MATTIDTHFKQKRDEYLEEIKTLCAQPSISAKGEGMNECADLVLDLLKRYGLDAQKYETPGNPVIVGHIKGESERTLLFYNHYDVQPAEPFELWETPPFEPTIRDGKMFARGAKDDKGELVTRLAAMDSVRAAHGGKLPCGVKFVVEGQEEVGSPTIAQFVKDHLDLLKSNAAIWEEGGVDNEGHPGTRLGCRGVLSIELLARTMSIDAHSGSAHMLPNAAWRLVEVLTSLKDPKTGLILIPSFYDNVQEATELDMKLFDEMSDIEQWARDQFGVKTFVNGMTGMDLQKAVFNPTCNIQGITTGWQGTGYKTVIPAEASVKIDFRLIPNQDPDDIFKKTRQHLDSLGFTDVEMKHNGAMWPYKAGADHPFIKLTSDSGDAAYGKKSRVRPLAGGSSPMYAFGGPLGIPIVSAGLGYWDNRTHAPNEHFRLTDFENAAKHIALILDGFAALEK